jgi:hypothetical protein
MHIHGEIRTRLPNHKWPQTDDFDSAINDSAIN